MTTATQCIIISADRTASGAQAYHHDFPEIRARGRSGIDAAERLVHQLARALDSALTTWRREALEKAIADARAFGVSAQ